MTTVDFGKENMRMCVMMQSKDCCVIRCCMSRM